MVVRGGIIFVEVVRAVKSLRTTALEYGTIGHAMKKNCEYY